ncbi:hypothetical protein LEP1GSC202_2218 [Leptospira yanagawae serovar Saopaulo str. Sao Paulo = ATCC 700523]|uniref:Uncharacterized protein n=1 Tax=Leptospira yanagawae serovar Saopaulo str. Sao Paulo = ATCC 700523 TaxID=1249483 RepID=A0A5E8HJA2_9LEPT|nr:hypothetical protein [Leptospira yanagawae]EOQ90793.1 hypothetical protein LEP1GSC202_2218 [Leptospira yanagawae serovar Saopaulo str. Sao Paulo = ATCC 700523]
MEYKTIVVETKAGFFKSSFQKLGPKIEEASSKLSKEGYDVFSITTTGLPGHPSAFITGRR